MLKKFVLVKEFAIKINYRNLIGANQFKCEIARTRLCVMSVCCRLILS